MDEGGDRPTAGPAAGRVLNPKDYLTPEGHAYRPLAEMEKHICWTMVVLERLKRNSKWSRLSDALQAMDDNALLNHLALVWKWLAVVKGKGVRLDKTVGRRLRAMSADITLLRNKRQHLENFLDPLKAREHYFGDQVAENVFLLTPPEWSSTIKGVRKLGGRLVVADVGPAVEELYQQLVEADLWILSWTPAELVEVERYRR